MSHEEHGTTIKLQQLGRSTTCKPRVWGNRNAYVVADAHDNGTYTAWVEFNNKGNARRAARTRANNTKHNVNVFCVAPTGIVTRMYTFPIGAK